MPRDTRGPPPPASSGLLFLAPTRRLHPPRPAAEGERSAAPGIGKRGKRGAAPAEPPQPRPLRTPRGWGAPSQPSLPVLSPRAGGGRAGVPLRRECRHRGAVAGSLEGGCGGELGSRATGEVRTGPAGMEMGLRWRTGTAPARAPPPPHQDQVSLYLFIFTTSGCELCSLLLWALRCPSTLGWPRGRAPPGSASPPSP